MPGHERMDAEVEVNTEETAQCLPPKTLDLRPPANRSYGHPYCISVAEWIKPALLDILFVLGVIASYHRLGRYRTVGVSKPLKR